MEPQNIADLLSAATEMAHWKCIGTDRSILWCSRDRELWHKIPQL